MRLRPGRPDIARHSHRFSVPVAESAAPLTVTWLGVSTLLLDDGSSTLMTDGYFSRLSLARVALGKVSPSAARVDGCLARLKVARLEAKSPVKASAYRCGEAWSALVHHQSSDRRLLIQGSAGFVRGALAHQRADVVYLGVGQLGLQPETYLVDYWAETVRAVGASRVVLIHWDDFFRPLSKPLRALPYAADNLDVSLDILSKLAKQDGIALDLPTVWRREDPWT
jgi:L-ascorbate metabolism protein UlaG (beta-lactamase superfamily)